MAASGAIFAAHVTGFQTTECTMRPVAAVLILGFLSSCALTASGAPGEDNHGKNLPNAQYPGANLNRANFSDSTLTNANFRKASLKEANFKGANVQAAVFQHADLTGADLRGIAGGANFGGAYLTKANLEGLTFQGDAFGGLQLSRREFQESHDCDERLSV